MRYDVGSIYIILGKNLKKVYDSLPDGPFLNGEKKIEHYSAMLGLSPSFLYHIFSGKMKSQHPSFETILHICNVFNCSVEELLKEDN